MKRSISLLLLLCLCAFAYAGTSSQDATTAPASGETYEHGVHSFD